MIGSHRLRRKLEADEFSVGSIINVNSPWLVDLSAAIGFDFVMIDAEHGPLTAESAEGMIRAAQAAGITALVRVPANVSHEILRFLDAGAEAIQVPHIDSAEDARRAVAAVKFPPLGDRGLAPITRAAGYGFDASVADYVATANRETMVLAMIESAAAVENIDAIIDVEGVDVLMIGSGDLSSSMGFSGVRDAPPVERAIDHVIARAKARGRPVALPAGDANGIHAGRARGATIIEIAASNWIVRAGKTMLEEAQK